MSKYNPGGRLRILFPLCLSTSVIKLSLFSPRKYIPTQKLLYLVDYIKINISKIGAKCAPLFCERVSIKKYNTNALSV